MLPPLPSPEVRHPKPGLVDVDYDLFPLPLSQELQCELLSQYEVLGAVGVDGDRLDLLVPHVQVLLHHRPHLIR